jgi:hypothetical protein
MTATERRAFADRAAERDARRPRDYPFVWIVTPQLAAFADRLGCMDATFTARSALTSGRVVFDEPGRVLNV